MKFFASRPNSNVPLKDQLIWYQECKAHYMTKLFLNKTTEETTVLAALLSTENKITDEKIEMLEKACDKNEQMLEIVEPLKKMMKN